MTADTLIVDLIQNRRADWLVLWDVQLPVKCPLCTTGTHEIPSTLPNIKIFNGKDYKGI